MGFHSLEEVLAERLLSKRLSKTGHCHDLTGFKANRLQRQKIVEENNHHPLAKSSFGILI